MGEINAKGTSIDDIKFEAFTEKELASLRTFHDQVIKILTSRLVKTGSLKSHYQGSCKDGILKETIICPDDEEVAHILMIMRTFLQRNNQTQIHIERILSILKNKSANSETHAHFDAIEKNYESYLKNPAITVIKNGEEFTSKKLFDYMICADKFHTDGDKKEFIDKLGLMETTKKAIFYDVIIGVCNWAILIDHVIADAILKKN